MIKSKTEGFTYACMLIVWFTLTKEVHELCNYILNRGSEM